MELASEFQHANGSKSPYYDPVPDALGTLYYDDIHHGTTLLDNHYDVCVTIAFYTNNCYYVLLYPLYLLYVLFICF